jgi:hypothetical protein
MHDPQNLSNFPFCAKIKRFFYIKRIFKLIPRICTISLKDPYLHKTNVSYGLLFWHLELSPLPAAKLLQKKNDTQFNQSYSNMTSFIGYINNVVIKLQIYINLHIHIVDKLWTSFLSNFMYIHK